MKGWEMEIKEFSLCDLAKELLEPEWNAPLFFVGDVGGTDARLGFARRCVGGGVFVASTRFHMTNKSFDDVIDFFKLILEAVHDSVIKRVTVGVLSVPGPVTGGVVAGPFNNLKGIACLEKFPVALFPIGRSVMLNDLEAGGFGVLAVSDAQAFPEYFDLMWEGSFWKVCERTAAGSALGRGRCVVLAPGTGLGSSLIHYNHMEQTYGVLPLELGAQTLPPRNDLAYIQKLAEHRKLPPNYESMVSGAGLEYHYRQLVDGRKPLLSAPQVARAAEEGDTDALKALGTFYSYLMRLGSEVSIAFVPLTVVLIGDNIVRNKFFFSDPEAMERLHRDALDHAAERLGYQSRVTYLRQKKFLNLNLVGCYRCALDLFQAKNQTSEL